MHRVEVNVQTGEQKIIELTPEEILELQNQQQPEPPLELTPQEKLEMMGITVQELKQILGL